MANLLRLIGRILRSSTYMTSLETKDSIGVSPMFSPCTRSLGTPPACCIADRRGCRKSPHPRSDQARAIGRHLQAPGPTITIFYYQFYSFLGYRSAIEGPAAPQKRVPPRPSCSWLSFSSASRCCLRQPAAQHPCQRPGNDSWAN